MTDFNGKTFEDMLQSAAILRRWIILITATRAVSKYRSNG